MKDGRQTTPQVVVPTLPVSLAWPAYQITFIHPPYTYSHKWLICAEAFRASSMPVVGQHHTPCSPNCLKPGCSLVRAIDLTNFCYSMPIQICSGLYYSQCASLVICTIANCITQPTLIWFSKKPSIRLCYNCNLYPPPKIELHDPPPPNGNTNLHTDLFDHESNLYQCVVIMWGAYCPIEVIFIKLTSWLSVSKRSLVDSVYICLSVETTMIYCNAPDIT